MTTKVRFPWNVFCTRAELEHTRATKGGGMMGNSLRQNLKGKRVVLKDGSIVTVWGGFGANPRTRGSALFVKDDQGNKYRVDGFDVKELAAIKEAEGTD